MIGTKKSTKILSWGVIILFLAINIFPFFWILITSFKPSSEIFGATAFQIIPNNPTLQNYTKVLFEKNILRSVFNSFVVSSVTTLYVVLVASMSAYIISRFRFRGKALLMALILGVSMFPQMITVGPIFNMFYQMGLLNTYWVVLPYSTITLPSAVWIMVTHFRRIPLSIEEAARIDGCSTWGTLWRIIFPVAAPGVFTTAIMTFIAAWNEYLLTATLNSDAYYQTVPVAINALRTQFEILWGEITAATIVVVIPTLLIVLLFQKQIVAGMTNGAVKE
ncbi:carbohydrate ABC transporter permease [Ruminococcaceae bacterium OttesenSCG-928-A16]|nr:carbohydrate ABC transporter permease [Ruminococcaceae bacterium OttesenSCG-928-A16]